jgi:hypothetical protein
VGSNEGMEMEIGIGIGIGIGYGDNELCWLFLNLFKRKCWTHVINSTQSSIEKTSDLR